MYCTLDDLKSGGMPESTIAQLSNDANPTIVNETVVNSMIYDASELIDSYLRARYNLPLLTEQAVVKEACVDIVRYKLYKRRGSIDESVQKIYDDALSTLRFIKRGEITLDEPVPAVKRGFYKSTEIKREFTKELMGNY